MNDIDVGIKRDISRILDLQVTQTTDIASIKAFQKTHHDKIDELEKEQKVNSAYRMKVTGAISLIYVLIGIFGSLFAKKIS